MTLKKYNITNHLLAFHGLQELLSLWRQLFTQTIQIASHIRDIHLAWYQTLKKIAYHSNLSDKLNDNCILISFY